METELTAGKGIEARLQRLEDRFAIMDLVAEYCAGIDDRDLERFVACYTRDAVLRHDDGVMRLDGRAAILDYYRQRFRDYGLTFHYPHSHAVTIDGPDNAHGVVTAHAEMGLGDEGWITAVRYSDKYRREDGRWRFAERVLAFWYYMPLAELPKGMASDLRKHYRGQKISAGLPESLETFQAWR